jgi:hypothetical protein
MRNRGIGVRFPVLERVSFIFRIPNKLTRTPSSQASCLVVSAFLVYECVCGIYMYVVLVACNVERVFGANGET